MSLGRSYSRIQGCVPSRVAKHTDV
ncbi:hypothetical protein F383_31827 [Gossypium arboreum]|uniref:Uncharacterized protein n=1 Tax=Gossypium arboreum TaxID=29729 RepID=A0A0B0MYX3_GOSAR|nr:hypothetical protein F383_31827 [Gossypium arboreum]